jgi:hypothetical protein
MTRERLPRAGDVATKNGIEVIVHFVRDGQIYGVRYREGASDESLQWGEIPEGCLGTFRAPLSDWYEGVRDAKYARASRS